MSDLQDKWDYDREAVYIESGHGEVTTGAMRYAHKRIAELKAQLASAEQPDLPPIDGELEADIDRLIGAQYSPDTKPIASAEAAERIAELVAKLAGAQNNSAFYRCCALSGEIPQDGAEPYKEKEHE